jgi:hypothetical protein
MNQYAEASQVPKQFTNESLREAFSPWIAGTFEDARCIGDVVLALAEQEADVRLQLFPNNFVMAGVVAALVDVEKVKEDKPLVKQEVYQLQIPGFYLPSQKDSDNAGDIKL